MLRLLVPATALAAAVLVAGCGAASGGGYGAGASAGKTTAPAAPNAPTIAAKSLGSAGSVLVDASGRPLYVNDQERAGSVLCTGDCLSFWSPVTVSGTPQAGSLPGTLGVVTRKNGTRQVTYDGKLLYSFTLDSPGKVTGDGFRDAFGGQRFTWHVVHGNGAISSGATSVPASPPQGY
jgi:predicted lipoprotein with Yx(FWY)xxD motif